MQKQKLWFNILGILKQANPKSTQNLNKNQIMPDKFNLIRNYILPSYNHATKFH